MNTSFANPLLWQQWQQRERLSLLAAFEDSATCTRAKEFCHSLSRDLGGQCQILQHVWVFSTFRMKELQEIAAEEASVADLVIISAHQAQSLPEEVKIWIDLWLRLKGSRHAVLLALLDTVYDDSPTSIRTYLRDVARRGNMEFAVESDAGA